VKAFVDRIAESIESDLLPGVTERRA